MRRAALYILALFCLCAPVQTQASGLQDFLVLYDGLLKAYTAPSAYKNIPYQGVDYDRWAAKKTGPHTKIRFLPYNWTLNKVRKE